VHTAPTDRTVQKLHPRTKEIIEQKKSTAMLGFGLGPRQQNSGLASALPMEVLALALNAAALASLTATFN